MYYICWNDLPDALVKTNDEKIFIFKGKWFWELEFDRSDLELYVHKSENNPRKIADAWDKQLPNDIELAFTIGSNGLPNRIHGHTMFLRRTKYYLFKNGKFVKKGNTTEWQNFKTALDVGYVAAPLDSEIVHFYIKASDPMDIIANKEYVSYTFDDDEYPERIANYEIVNQEFPPEFQLSQLKTLFPLTDDGVYLALFHFGSSETYYCILPELKSNVSNNNYNFSYKLIFEMFFQCKYKEIFLLFDCPEAMMLLKYKSWTVLIWRLTQLNVHELLQILAGASMATFLLNLILLIITLMRIYQLIM